jgi:hypothetical protein
MHLPWSRDNEECAVCREYVKGVFLKCPLHQLIQGGGSSMFKLQMVVAACVMIYILEIIMETNYPTQI